MANPTKLPEHEPPEPELSHDIPTPSNTGEIPPPKLPPAPEHDPAPLSEKPPSEIDEMPGL